MIHQFISMYNIPPDILQIINSNEMPENLIFKDKDFALVVDPTHTEKSDHYCAWSLKQQRDLLSLTKDDIPALERLKEKVYSILNMSNKTHNIFIHFPPSWWHLHIHFVENNHFLLCPEEDVYYFDDIINNLKTNTDYYRRRVTIDNITRKSSNKLNNK